MYRKVLHEALGGRVISFEGTPNMVLRTGVLQSVKTHFIHFFEELTSTPNLTSAAIHRANLCKHKDRWAEIRAEHSCFCCNRREWQHCLPCGHGVCETCIQIFGEVKSCEPWLYRVDSCFLCTKEWSEDFVVTVKAPTRGVSILCLDGGGVRGVISLALLKRIQDHIGLAIPIQRYFKLVAGVSSGNHIPGPLKDPWLILMQEA